MANPKFLPMSAGLEEAEYRDLIIKPILLTIDLPACMSAFLQLEGEGGGGGGSASESLITPHSYPHATL